MHPFRFGAGAKIEPVTREGLMRQLIIVGGLALMGVVFVVVFLIMSEAGTGKPAKKLFANAQGQYNFLEAQAASGLLPGQYVIAMTGEGGKIVGSQEVFADIKASVTTPADQPGTFYTRLRDELLKKGGQLTPSAEAEYRELDKHPKPAFFKLDAEVQPDLYHVRDDLKKEYNNGEKIPLPGADPQKGPFYEPIQMETPWIAFDGLCRDVAGASPADIAAADNGQQWIAATEVEAIHALRGKVFTMEGVLWMLREQPLRRDVTYKGEKAAHAYYGVIAYLRPGIGPEPKWVNDCAAFTAFEVPDALKKLALKPGQHPRQDDELSKGGYRVRLTGAWFRRIAYVEPVAELEVVAEDFPEDPFLRKYHTEGYMPWLVCQAATTVEGDFPWREKAREMVTQFTEDRPYSDDILEFRNKFDEAGYYLSLAMTRRPPVNDSQPVETLTMRMLELAPNRAKYRGAKVNVRGTMFSGYQPVILPPNVSGLRNVWRVYVLDALQKSEEDEHRMWFIDTLEPPLDMRGRAKVSVDGYYYRSQVIDMQLHGQVVPVARPLIVTAKIAPLDPAQVEKAKPGIDMTVVGITIGSIALVLVVLFVIGQREKKTREQFEQETLATVRSRMNAVRNRLVKQRQSGAPSAGQLPSLAGDASAGTANAPGPAPSAPAAGTMPGEAASAPPASPQPGNPGSPQDGSQPPAA